MAPFPAATYRRRLQRLYQRMGRRGIHALYLPPSGDLEYLTGFRRRKAANTDIVQPADWAYGAILTPYAGVYLVAPYMVSSYARAHGAPNPVVNDVIYVPEHGDPIAFMTSLPRRFGLGDLGTLPLRSATASGRKPSSTLTAHSRTCGSSRQGTWFRTAARQGGCRTGPDAQGHRHRGPGVRGGVGQA